MYQMQLHQQIQASRQSLEQINQMVSQMEQSERTTRFNFSN